MAFRDILGNWRVKRVLEIALQRNRVPNSLLFCGPEGVGKKSVAYVVAKAMNCERMSGDSCDECTPCRAIDGKKWPDVLEITAESDVIKIDQMRLIRNMAYLRPMSGKKRFFIVDEAERMTEEAANSLLKILEEPPLFSHIVLITDNPHLILPTIKSRCQILNFSPVEKGEIERMLRENGIPAEKARIISLVARGNLEKALDIEWEEIRDKRGTAWKMLLSLLRKEDLSLFLRTYAFSRRNLIREELEELLEILASFLRDIILLKERGDSRLLLNPDFEKNLAGLDNLLDLEQTIKFSREVDLVISGLARKLNVNLLVSSFYSRVGVLSHA